MIRLAQGDEWKRSASFVRGFHTLLQEWFSHVRWPSPGQLRHQARQIYRMIRIAPSHRRDPHPCWTGPMNLLLSLILGHGRKRIVSLFGPPPQINVLVRGFSAGSFVGLTVLHLLWKWQVTLARGVLGAIACPPSLLERIPHERMQQLILVHYRSDQLCMWGPAEGHALARRTVYVSGDWKLLNHFGSQEHSYCHWLDNIPAPGVYPAWRVMLDNPDMANPQTRDASALRLLSWLSFSLDKQTAVLLAKLMAQLATEEEGSPAILSTIRESSIGATWNSLTEIRSGLIDQITVSNLAQPNDIVTQLHRTFLARLSFPRLVHFLDLVLPQMLPHQRIREQNQARQLTSHWLSLLEQEGNSFTPLLHMNFLFSSHAGVVHVLVEWYRYPLLVFSDYPKVEKVPLEVLRSATTLETYRQHVAMGIRSGQSTLCAFESNGDLYKMIGILITSNVPQRVGQENRWKHVAPCQTELAVLPQEMAETFCRYALEGFQNYQNYQYISDWVGIFSPTEGGRVPVKMHHIELLGDTRSADDLGVFCTMPAERLCIGCGLTSSERPEGTHPNQKALLREAAIKLLSAILLPDHQEGDNEEVMAYKKVCKELRQQHDGHFLSMVSSLVLAILTGRTDLCVSGVFGAGKTRAAAALIGGLMIMDPSLNLMVMTKENTAAKAFTDHLLSLQLPESVYCRAGRIVGYLETKKGASHKTRLDINAGKTQ